MSALYRAVLEVEDALDKRSPAAALVGADSRIVAENVGRAAELLVPRLRAVADAATARLDEGGSAELVQALDDVRSAADHSITVTTTTAWMIGQMAGGRYSLAEQREAIEGLVPQAHHAERDMRMVLAVL